MTDSVWVWREKAIQLPPAMADGKPWPKITVVTPSYNQGHYIEETLRSVLMQGYPNLELIVIDGGSKDNTVEIIKKYEKQIAYWVSEKDNGQTHAINKGFEKATGEICAYLNSDDIYMPYTLRLIAEIFTTFGVEWVTGHRSHQVDHDVISPLPHATVRFNGLLYRKGFHVPWVMGWNQQPSTFWSAALFRKAGGKFNESMQCSFDIDLWIRLSAFTELTYLRSVLAMMRQHADQKSRTLRLDYKEIEGNAARYGFYPLAVRRLLKTLMNIPVLRKIPRLILKNPEAQWIDWDPVKSRWHKVNKSIF